MKFKFVMPQLIHTTKWKFDYNVFRKNRLKCLLNAKDILVMRIFLKELTLTVQDMIFE